MFSLQYKIKLIQIKERIINQFLASPRSELNFVYELYMAHPLVKVKPNLIDLRGIKHAER
jgi:hypothetical protein